MADGEWWELVGPTPNLVDAVDADVGFGLLAK